VKPQVTEKHQLIVRIEREGHTYYFNSGEMDYKTAKSSELRDFLLDFIKSVRKDYQ
jgi:hypothetical protein